MTGFPDESVDAYLHFLVHVTSQAIEEFSVLIEIHAASCSFSPYTLPTPAIFALHASLRLVMLLFVQD